MKLFVYGEEYPCDRAEKGADYIKAYDDDGNVVIECGGISDFGGYALTDNGGEPAEFETPDLPELLRSVVIYEAGDAPAGARIVRSWPLSPPMRISPTVAGVDIKAVENLTNVSVSASSQLLTLRAYAVESGRWMVSAEALLDAAP